MTDSTLKKFKCSFVKGGEQCLMEFHSTQAAAAGYCKRMLRTFGNDGDVFTVYVEVPWGEPGTVIVHDVLMTRKFEVE